MIKRILNESRMEWEENILLFNSLNMQARVSEENTPQTLHELNVRLSGLFDRVMPYYGRARAYNDVLDRLIDRTIKVESEGKNEAERRANGINACRKFIVHYPDTDYETNLFDLRDQWSLYYEQLDSIVKSLRFKSDAKITNNSLLSMESKLI
ncbi:hypothetical protein ACQR3P_28905 [Rhodococcus sp. IEGM1300]